MDSIEPFETGQKFINKMCETIEIKTRFYTSEDKLEYLVVCGLNSARVTHEKINKMLIGGDWKFIKLN